MKFLLNMKIGTRLFLVASFTALPVLFALITLVLSKGIVVPLLLLTVALVLSFLSVTVVARSIVGPLRSAQYELEAVLRGDLTHRIAVHGIDETSKLGKSFNEVLDKFNESMKQFARSSQVLSRTSFGLDSGSKTMLDEVKRASLEVNSAASASEQMATTSAEIARNCVSAERNSLDANNAAIDGQKIIDETVSVMNRVNDMVKTSAQIVEGLGSRSEQIGAVIDLINDIADQTNLLALNAAIEAARAGEHGKGFAVVADEVRKLAERTTSATKEIGDTIKVMQSEARQAVSAAERGKEEVELGLEETKKSGDSFKKTLSRIDVVSGEIRQIAVASNEQSATVEEIARNIQQISSVMENAAQNAEGNSRTATELSGLFVGLNKVIGNYRFSTFEEAESLVKEAAAFVKSAGVEKGMEELNNPKGRFVKNGIYVTGHRTDGVILANPFTPHTIGGAPKPGHPTYEMNRKCNEVAKAGGGWHEYELISPLTNTKVRKRSRIEPVPGTNVYVMCGISL